MRKACSSHEFPDAAAIFTGVLRTRACRHCTHVEVILDGMARWIPLEQYLERAARARRERRARAASARDRDGSPG